MSDKIRRALAGVDLDERSVVIISELELTLSPAQQGFVRDLLVRARRQGRADEREVRRTRRRERKAAGYTFDTDAQQRIARTAAERAGDDLALFEDLVEHYRAGDRTIALAAAGLRARGYSWADVGRSMGVTRQSAWERFGRQAQPDTGPSRTGEGASPLPNPPEEPQIGGTAAQQDTEAQS